jgi:multicomponent Na+:H+ antiporter subunit E
MRWFAVFCWAYLTWTILSWTLSVEQVAVGLALSALTGLACAPLGLVAGPWSVLRPGRAVRLLRLGAVVAVRVVRANLRLTRRIWSLRLPLRSGMVIVPTTARSDGALTAVGLLSSVVVDSQLVDLDRSRHELQYHSLWIDSADPLRNRERINAPIEGHLSVEDR